MEKENSLYYIFMPCGERTFVIGKNGEYVEEISEAMSFEEKN